jgi:hypothetical protein
MTSNDEAILALIADTQGRACPHCGKAEDVVHIGQSIWLCCKTHKVKWLVGWDLSFPAQPTDEQQHRYYEIGANKFEHIYREIAEAESARVTKVTEQ